jgi:hypothetical protein
VQRRLIAPFVLVSFLAACQGGNLTDSIPGTLSRTQSVINANGTHGAGGVAAQNGIPALLVPVNINGSPLNAPAPTPIPSVGISAPTPIPTTSPSLTPAPAASATSSTGSSSSGGGGSGGGGSGGGGASVTTPTATPTAASVTGFQNLHGQVVTLAGNGTPMVGGGGANSNPRNAPGDGIGARSLLNGPGGITVDSKSGIVYFADTRSGLIRTLSLAAEVHTAAGGRAYYPASQITATGAAQCGQTLSANTTDNTWSGQPADYLPFCNGYPNPAAAPPNWPWDGTGVDSRFYLPYGMAADSKGDLYVCDSGLGTLRKLTLSAGGEWLVKTFATGFLRPHGVVCDNSTYPPVIYVTDSGNNCIYKIPSTAPPAGTNYPVGAPYVGNLVPGYLDAQNGAARFNTPMGIARAPNGDLFVADANNNIIRRIDPTGNVSTLAGSGARGLIDGTGANARFWYPMGLSLDPAGNLYVADSQNCCIRMVSPLGTVSTLAGQGGNAGFADGTFATALFNLPTDVSVDGFGNLFVTDYGNNRIRQIIR